MGEVPLYGASDDGELRTSAPAHLLAGRHVPEPHLPIGLCYQLYHHRLYQLGPDDNLSEGFPDPPSQHSCPSEILKVILMMQSRVVTRRKSHRQDRFSGALPSDGRSRLTLVTPKEEVHSATFRTSLPEATSQNHTFPERESSLLTTYWSEST